MPVLAAILGWFGRLFTGVVTWAGTAILGHVAASQAAEAAARLARIGVILGLITAAVNLIVVPQCASLFSCWATYSGELGDVKQYIGYFVPMDLLLCLSDIYLFVLLVMFTVKSISKVAEFGR